MEIPDEDLDKIRELHFSGCSIREIVRALDGKYSRGKIHNLIREMESEQSENEAEDVTESPVQTNPPDTTYQTSLRVMDETMQMWGITPDVYFMLAAEAYNRGYPNVGALIVQKCIPWLKFEDTLTREWGKQVTADGLMKSMIEWATELREYEQLKERLRPMISKDVGEKLGRSL